VLLDRVLPFPAVNGGVLPENWSKETARDEFFMRQIEFVPPEVELYGTRWTGSSIFIYIVNLSMNPMWRL
jgi:hypothetical protein